MLAALNIFFFVFHIALISFNCLGWLWVRARRLHLISIGITWASWIILGFWYGFGFCPLTDWHWQVLQRLGKNDLPASYLKYLFDTITGLNIPADLVDAAAVIGLFLATLIAFYLQYLRTQKK